MPKALFLCSGTGSVGEPFREGGWEVTDVDWDNRFGAEIVEDITTMNYKAMFEPGEFDVIWASPDRTQYSIARARAPPRDFEKADKLVQSCLDIIEYLKPQFWFIENPDTGYLKTRTVVEGLPWTRVDYCMYQNPAMYRKRTRIWTNCKTWQPKLCDRSHVINGKHMCQAQHSPPQCYKTSFSKDDLHRLPKALCQEMFNVCVSYDCKA